MGELEKRGLGWKRRSSVWSQSPPDTAKNSRTKKMGRASAIWSKPWPTPEVMAIDSASTRTITNATIRVEMNRTTGNWRFALRIAFDFTEGILPPPAAVEKKRAAKSDFRRRHKNQ